MREMGIAETELQSVGRYEGAVNGEPLSRQSREVVSKLQDNRSHYPELSACAFTESAAG